MGVRNVEVAGLVAGFDVEGKLLAGAGTSSARLDLGGRVQSVLEEPGLHLVVAGSCKEG